MYMHGITHFCKLITLFEYKTNLLHVLETDNRVGNLVILGGGLFFTLLIFLDIFYVSLIWQQVTISYP